ncbi:fungal-specific transcription factor domain-containing protein [Talaromyces proteolyticus]|uniref:Fungal-specific transcription factor domain-containing protein n=1 Tax=Talaromyces proteolyticus TaxID=1131652 RepID=A0AAD4KTL9_9EURO|nr:fungal-specific transcription factor domain-containing protein [Talaromyces proteolyticus]KAH8696630.1 fungal-specific transcription factor domain-containing protein [Talaromyces proteolyticus]
MVRERAKRSKTGCLTCRKRKVKCDETRFKCNQCIRHRFSCEWPNEPPQVTSQSLFRGANRRNLPANSKLSVQPALTDRHIACANSLILSQQDRLSLEYFPSSTVYCFYDFFEWGALQYLVKVIAPRSKLVTRMILALSASEMHQSGLKNDHNPVERPVDEGLIHYTQALQELLKELSGPTQGDLVDAKLATLIFMIHYELQFTGSIDRVQTHLRGFWALISDHSIFEKRHTQSRNLLMEVSDPHLVLSCQLTGWALYLDITATSFGVSSSLLKLLLSSDNPALSPMRLYQLSRLGGHRLWGEPLSGDHMLADAELYRPVELGWLVLLARFTISDLRSGGKRHNAENTKSSSILDHLLDLRERYCDLLHIADESPKSRWTSNLEVITRFASFYWANILFYHRMLNDPAPQNDLHKEAVFKITNLLYYRHKQDSDLRKQSRVVWCTFMAAIETHDPVHRDWLVKRLRDVRNVSIECKQLWSQADAILRK